MKYTLLSLALIFTQLIGMITTNVSSQKDDEFYRYVYKKEIARTPPLDVCKQIDNLCAQLKNKEISKSFIKNTGRTGNINSRFPQPLRISNNGRFFTHDLATDNSVSGTTLFDTTRMSSIATQLHGHFCFSPNNKFFITINEDTINYHNIKDNFAYNTVQTIGHCFGITISDDSKYILAETRNAYAPSTPTYKLWTLDAQNMLKSIPLKRVLFDSIAVIFHPDNKHIIHSNYGDELRLYNIATSEDIIIFPASDTDINWITKLMLSPDHTTIIAEADCLECNNKKYILFNIENLDKVTAVLIPEQSLDDKVAKSELSELLHPQCIPHKKMITHITNCGHTLQLLDENMECIAAHHTPKESAHITALAVNNTGDYLAAGYSDGSIMIWDISSSHPAGYEKIFRQTSGTITSLTFNDHQQILSQSQSGKLCRPIVGKKEETLCKYGTTILWDVYGNEIINCGYQIVKSIMSPNGKTIVTLPLINVPKEYKLELTYYQINDENLAQYSQKEMTLTQLARLMAATNLDQTHLDAQQLTHLPYNQ
jgi:WD40 repeat protein